jgi:hypothetical protein
MKTTSLFQIGGIALLLAAILYIIGNLIYVLSGQSDAPTTVGLAIAFFGDIFMVLGLGALFARQSLQGGILGLIGFVLLVVAQAFFFGSYAVSLGVAAGVMSNEQIAQVPAYNLANPIMSVIWLIGRLALGISIYRAQVFPKYAGALLVLTVLLQVIPGGLILALSLDVTWAWLGWSLLRDQRVVSMEPTPAT